jgi:hypothetical protein
MRALHSAYRLIHSGNGVDRHIRHVGALRLRVIAYVYPVRNTAFFRCSVLEEALAGLASAAQKGAIPAEVGLCLGVVLLEPIRPIGCSNEDPTYPGYRDR